MQAKEPGQRSAVKAASRRSRSRAARAFDGAPLVRQRPPMRSWPDTPPSMRNKTLRCE